MSNLVFILVPRLTNRVKYTFKLVFREFLGQEIHLSSKGEEFEAFQGVKLQYGVSYSSTELYFHASGLLFESGLGNVDVECSQFEGIKTLFPVYNQFSALPFDAFAAVFFMVSRYEEYLPYVKDEHGRFTARESIAYRHQFLHKAVVHHWINQVASVIQRKYAGFRIPARKFSFLPTYDIDQAWAFRHKGLIRNAATLVKLAIDGHYGDVRNRLQVLAGRKPDPFDTYDLMHELHRAYSLDPVYFILFGSYGRYDKNIPIYNRYFGQLIKSLADRYTIGVHPSYASNEDVALLKKEVEGLSLLIHREILHSRQHFLKLHLPETYRRLTMLEIRYDFTMGFAAQPGFRAGIARPYPFYDVDSETELPLTVIPFQVMDGTLRDYMKLDPENAMGIIQALLDEVKEVGGMFVSLWHNESLSEFQRWEGWRKVYYFLCEKACS